VTIFDYINESPWWAMVFIFLIFAGIEGVVKAWKGRE